MCKNFFPLSMLNYNVGSNNGLESILLNHIKPVIQSDPNYFLLKVDINIYWRMLKVKIILYLLTIQLIFSKKPEFFFLQDKLVLFLGTWHPFKMACEVIQQYFLCTFIGPGI